MDVWTRFKDSSYGKGYSEELLAERKRNKKFLNFIFIISTLFYITDIILSNYYLGPQNLTDGEAITILSLLALRAVGFFFYFKYEGRENSRMFKVFELSFVLLFSATTIGTWNAQINMDLHRAYIVGLDAGWILRYILILYGQLKFKAFMDLSVMVFGVIKICLMTKEFNMGFLQGVLQIIYVLILLYSQEKVQKMKFLRTFSLKKTEATLKNILNNIPENIAILNLDGDFIYYNDYLDISFHINHEKEEIDLFSKFFAIKPRERYKCFQTESWTEADRAPKQQPLRRKSVRQVLSKRLTLNPQNFQPRIVKPNPHLQEEVEFTKRKQTMLVTPNMERTNNELNSSRNIKDSHASLTEALTSIEQFTTLQDVIDFFVTNISSLRTYSNKENNFFIFDAKYRDDEDFLINPTK